MDGEVGCIVLHAQLCTYLFISLLMLEKVTSAVLKAISWAPVCLHWILRPILVAFVQESQPRNFIGPRVCPTFYTVWRNVKPCLKSHFW